MAEAKRKRGRPKGPGKKKEYGFPIAEIKEIVCTQTAEGATLRAICRRRGMPSFHTIYLWLDEDPEFGARFKQAKQVGMDAIAQETLDIVDKKPERIRKTGAIDMGDVANRKLRVWQRMQLLAKWDTARYGQKVQVDAAVKHQDMSDAELAERLAAFGVQVQGAGADDDDD